MGDGDCDMGDEYGYGKRVWRSDWFGDWVGGLRVCFCVVGFLPSTYGVCLSILGCFFGCFFISVAGLPLASFVLVSFGTIVGF